MLLALLLLQAALARDPSLQVIPAEVQPGDAFLVLVKDAKTQPLASVAGRALYFYPIRGGFAAVGGLPLEMPPGQTPIRVALPPSSESAARELSATLKVEAPHFPRRNLELPSRYVEPPPPAIQARIDEDRAAFERAFAQVASPPLFETDFAWPRHDRVTANYGEKRELNGQKPSQHYGLDIAGRVGDPVKAANDGRVVMVRDCFASGQTVVLWHGASLYTTYLHLSRTFVKEGARVLRGEMIGLVGKSGRASGPHLHWGVKVGDLYVDPATVLRLPLGRGPTSP
ncbi:MAG TPA: M23 family metallopeptidase [Anaeromyxobacteraceae bacterium]|nr:M23 family metallopeptidase [Anaeromyxobacteraceae bacterium]